MWRSIAKIVGVYKLYELLLEREVRRAAIPTHIAFILDGNRRWARERGLPPTSGHEWGARRVEEVLRWCYDLGVKTVTLYVLSTENLAKRSKEELENIFRILSEKLDEIMSSKELDKRRVRVKVLGDKSLLPPHIVSKIEQLEERTRGYGERFLNLALAYGGRKEIVDAVKRILYDALSGRLDYESLDEKVFEKYLYTGDLPYPEPDVVIRTSGEMRISNFLLWQIAYSELIFLDVYWPDFRRIDLLRAIRLYQKRQRRFGS
jgi:Undecaprenyl pyrophosphate synthetase (EC 2.5.1.31)